MGLAISSGCGVQQRAAEKLIDPQLHREGVLVENNAGRPARDGSFALGGYAVTKVERWEQAAVPGAFLGDDNPRTRPTQALGVRFELSTPEGERWIGECLGQRRQPPDHDLAAVADELRDEVALRCSYIAQTDEGPGDPWLLSLDGDLADNLLGSLERQGEGEAPPQVVEVVLWYQLLNFTRRRLPASLALLRATDSRADRPTTAAAMILDSPERAWLTPELGAHTRGLSLAVLVSLRLIPLGFES
ncbi:hypothetical protein PPSIR1_40869 [Plesiocystis pacifica SIR-1]|uniref:Uncharacterized protein n=1 Tax=Plesiocystis pacifica SIR-1 TaxID=391625 RepID=A6GHF1_9BACT|nr:hypothetical protein [Plesiocystis pacifica]EDM74715.1 hypothetical protein PPSIR1_40869 [Plesiocystis pacifica SIR-1]